MVLTLAHFDPFDIARSGQCFRMAALEGDCVRAFAGDRRVTVQALGAGRFAFDCGPDDFDAFWRRYFDLDTDYEAIWRAALGKDEALGQAARAYPGLRILRQDPWEALCSFLLSQRKSIPAIRTCVEALCRAFGQDRGEGFYAFPTPKALLSAGEKAIRACATGYRAPYLMDAARLAVTGDLPLCAETTLTDAQLCEKLLRVRGVGVKVSACAMLYGFHRLNVYPVDVWISRVIAGDYGGKSPFEAYGAYAGVYQQYLFLHRLDKEKAARGKKKASGSALNA